MTDWLLLLKLSLGGVLLFDLLILQRKPAADAIVQRLDWQAELVRKGTYGWLMPTAALLVLLLDRAQGNDPRPALALLALVVAYLALPRSLALEREHLLLDGWRIPLVRVLSVKPVEDGVAVSLERFGWLTEQHLPAGAVADALQERLAQRHGREP
ncbi:MAG TPA: hypothetical protein EYI97_01785 [Candidatus Poseidoniales archaeon]|nr:hypothetical protein [Candidatus Poseidoniales archaeon]